MKIQTTTDRPPASAEQQVAALVDKFTPDKQKLIRSVRKALQQRFPTANELVYDYSRALVIAYGPNERGSDAIVSISADAEGVRLVFTRGVLLPDPQRILRGDARQTRFVRLEASSMLNRPEVGSLLTAAVHAASTPLGKSGSGALIIKSSKKRTKSQPVKPQPLKTSRRQPPSAAKKTGKG